MATTTNYSWTTPDDTDLVKDGAAAIRTLGSSADTTVKALNPGTTAGDVDYYTTSTAKARLGIGTAGQVLTVNSGATAPEWANASSGLTKITSGSFSAAASVQISNCFTSTYKNYYIILDDLGHSAGGDDVYMKFMRATNTVYSSDYFYGGASYNSSGTSYNWSGNSDTKIILGKVATNNRHQFHINVGNVGNSNEDPSYQAAGNGSINGYSIVGGMLNTTSYTFTGLEFSGVGNLTGNYTVFGLAK